MLPLPWTAAFAFLPRQPSQVSPLTRRRPAPILLLFPRHASSRPASRQSLQLMTLAKMSQARVRAELIEIGASDDEDVRPPARPLPLLFGPLAPAPDFVPPRLTCRVRRRPYSGLQGSGTGSAARRQSFGESSAPWKTDGASDMLDPCGSVECATEASFHTRVTDPNPEHSCMATVLFKLPSTQPFRGSLLLPCWNGFPGCRVPLPARALPKHLRIPHGWNSRGLNVEAP